MLKYVYVYSTVAIFMTLSVKESYFSSYLFFISYSLLSFPSILVNMIITCPHCTQNLFPWNELFLSFIV